MYFIAVALLFGLAIGSFLNVVIWRVPQGLSIVRPPSACPRCESSIRSRDNIPVVSWLILRGKCRDCAAPIRKRYPLVELTTGGLFALVTWWYKPLDPQVGSWPVLIALLFLVAISVSLTLIDIDTHRLPDAIVLPAVLVTVVLLTGAAAIDGSAWPLIRAGIGGVILFVAYFAMLVAYPQGMGFGDVKLAAVVGLYLGWMGWGALVIGGFSAFILGGVYSIGLLIFRKANRKSGIPFGPWMLLGAWVGIVAGNEIMDRYIAVFA